MFGSCLVLFIFVFFIRNKYFKAIFASKINYGLDKIMENTQTNGRPITHNSANVINRQPCFLSTKHSPKNSPSNLEQAREILDGWVKD